MPINNTKISNIGILTHSGTELPQPIFQVISRFCDLNNKGLFKCQTPDHFCKINNPSRRFRLLQYLESQVVGYKKNKSNPLTLKSCKPEDTDIVFCWGVEGHPQLSNSETQFVCFFLNNQRFDEESTGLKEVLNQIKFEISLRQLSGNPTIILANIEIKPFRTLIRTRLSVIEKLAVITEKYLYGYPVPTDDNLYCQEKFVSTKSINKITDYFRLIIKNLNQTLKTKKGPSKSEWKIFLGYLNDEFIFNNQAIEGLTEISEVGSFYADPFLIEYQGTTFLLFEEFRYCDGKGVISAIEVGALNQTKYLGSVLERNYHLSFPFLFEHNGSVYMIPESGSELKVDLYRADIFPLKWSLCKTLLSGHFYSDSIIYYHEGIFWLFTSYSTKAFSQNEQLFLYYTDNIFEENFKPHPCNPISIGARCSRMAGGIIEKNGKLFRPAQDCSEIYGGKIRFMEISVLTKSMYVEFESGSLLPLKGYKGTHTISCTEKYFVIDVY